MQKLHLFENCTWDVVYKKVRWLGPFFSLDDRLGSDCYRKTMRQTDGELLSVTIKVVLSKCFLMLIIHSGYVPKRTVPFRILTTQSGSDSWPAPQLIPFFVRIPKSLISHRISNLPPKKELVHQFVGFRRLSTVLTKDRGRVCAECVFLQN